MCTDEKQCEPETYQELKDRSLSSKERESANLQLREAGLLSALMTKLFRKIGVRESTAITACTITLMSIVQVKTSLKRSDFLEMMGDMWDETAEKLAELKASKEKSK